MRGASLLMRVLLVAVAVVATAVVLPPTVVAADGQSEAVGTVKTASGQTYAGREGQRLAVAVGDHIYQGDRLITGAKSSLGVIFRDDTILSLGSGSEIQIAQFAFAPSEGAMNFLVKVGKGTAQFITGQMVKIAPNSMRVETPLSTIGIRGTRFLVKVD